MLRHSTHKDIVYVVTKAIAVEVVLYLLEDNSHGNIITLQLLKLQLSIVHRYSNTRRNTKNKLVSDFYIFVNRPLHTQ